MQRFTAYTITDDGHTDPQFFARYDRFVSTHAHGHLFQSRLWSDVKSNWKSHYIIVEDDGDIVGTLCVRERRLSPLPFTFLYASRGPVCAMGDVHTLNLITEQLKLLAQRQNAICLKMDPNIPAVNRQFLHIMENLGFSHQDDYFAFEGVQARFLHRIDLRNMDENQLLASFSKKHRYGVRTAIKRGVIVKSGSRADIPLFYDLLKQTARRGNFTIRSMAYFENLYDALGEHGKLLLAYDNGKCVAAAWVTLYAGLAHYLYGASASNGRQNMPTYLLQWEAMRHCLACGAHTYDMRGVPGNASTDDPLYGLYHFKKGFGGQTVELLGELNMVFKPVFCQVFDQCNQLRSKMAHRSAEHRNLAHTRAAL